MKEASFNKQLSIDQKNPPSTSEIRRESLHQQQEDIPIVALEPWLQEYKKKMNSFKCSSAQQLKKHLSRSNIQKKKIFYKSIEKTIFKKVQNTYQLKVSLGYFETSVSILISKFNSFLFQRELLSIGSFGELYIQKQQENTFVIKSQQIQNAQVNIDQRLNLVLKEYFFVLIASTLGFGPKISKIFGFDIVIFENAIEFSMQYCKFPSEKNKWKNIQSDLYTGLKIMHSLQIVHQDIKPENVNWSPYFQKWVFLDFGFTSFIKQKPGKRTLTSFIGTYSYTSQAMKNLYHLKTSGFVDLYANDVFGLEIVKIKSKHQECFQLENFKSSCLFYYFTQLSKMQYKIFLQSFFEINDFFQQKKELKNQFLGLLLKEIERNRINKIKSNELFSIYQKFKKYEVEKQQFIRNKEKQECFKSFLQEEENFLSNFLYLKQTDLRQLIQDKWNIVSFMRKLFQFYNEVLFSNSDLSWRRMRFITDIIANFYVVQSKGKNWFWKFQKILEMFQSFFLEKKLYEPLKQIVFYHHLFNDSRKQKYLIQILLEQNLTKMDERDFFFSEAIIFSSVDEIKKSLLKLKVKKNDTNQKKQFSKTFYETVELIIKLIESKSNKKEILNQIQQYLRKTSTNNQTIALKQSFQKIIAIWKGKFFIEESLKNQIQDIQFVFKKNFQYSHQPLSRLTVSMEILKYLKDAPSNKVQHYFRKYPIFEEIPTMFSFRYHLNQQKWQKVNEIALNIFQLHRENLQEISSELLFLQQRWDQNSEEMKQELQYFFLTFSSYFQKKLSVHNIQKYWKFYSQIVLSLIILGHKFDENKKSQIVSSAELIIKSFNFETLSPTNKIYILLLTSFKAYIETSEIQTFQFLNGIEKYSLFATLYENSQVLAQCLQMLSFFEKNNNGNRILCQTDLYSQILKSKKKNQILFLSSAFLLEYVCDTYLFQDNVKKVFYLMNEFTEYLTNTYKRPLYLDNFFHHIMRQSSMSQLTVILSTYASEQTTIKNIRENNFLSAFIFLLFLSTQTKVRREFKAKQIKRILTLSILSIDNFPYLGRVQMKKSLNYKVIERQKKQSRKNQIFDRRIDFSLQKLDFLGKRIDKVQKSNRSIGSFYQKKCRKLKKNLERNISSQVENIKRIN